MDYELLATIVQQAKDGDKGALEQLYYETYNRVYFYAFKIFNDENDAADVVQEVYIKVFTHISELNDAKAFTKWLYTITVNECKQKMRRDHRQILTEEGDEFFERILDTEPELDQRLVHRDARTFLFAVIDFLPEEQKRAVLLYYYEQLTISQIAEIEEVSEATIKSRLVLARKKLRAAVEAEERRTGTRLLAVGMPALAAVLAEGALLVSMPVDLASRALAVALAAVGFVDGDGAFTYIATNETEADADDSLRQKLNRGIIVELKPIKIFIAGLLLLALVLGGMLVLLERREQLPSDAMPHETEITPETDGGASTGGEQGENRLSDTPGDTDISGMSDGSTDEILKVGSSVDAADVLTAGQELARLPEAGETYWMEVTPEETGYYCFEARFEGELSGELVEFRTWLDAPSWTDLHFSGSNTVCAKWSEEDPERQEIMHMYFTDDSILHAGQKYVVNLTLGGDFGLNEIRLIKTDIPFSL